MSNHLEILQENYLGGERFRESRKNTADLSRSAVFFRLCRGKTRPIPFGVLLDALKWACEMSTHRWPSVRLFDADRLPFEEF
jgi:hypothetical protein